MAWVQGYLYLEKVYLVHQHICIPDHCDDPQENIWPVNEEYSVTNAIEAIRDFITKNWKLSEDWTYDFRLKILIECIFLEDHIPCGMRSSMKGKSFKSLKIYLADFVDNLNFKHFLFYSDMETSADNITSFDKFNLIFSNKKFRVERNKVK